MGVFRLFFIVFVLLCSVSPSFAEENSIEVTNAWSRATTKGAHAGVIYLTLKNTGTEADSLLSAQSNIAKNVMLHTTIMEGDIAKMRHVEKLLLPVNETIVMEPGGLHIMLMGLTQALEKEQTVPLTLTFENADNVTVDVTVK